MSPFGNKDEGWDLKLYVKYAANGESGMPFPFPETKEIYKCLVIVLSTPQSLQMSPFHWISLFSVSQFIYFHKCHLHLCSEGRCSSFLAEVRSSGLCLSDRGNLSQRTALAQQHVNGSGWVSCQLCLWEQQQCCSEYVATHIRGVVVNFIF